MIQTLLIWSLTGIPFFLICIVHILTSGKLTTIKLPTGIIILILSGPIIWSLAAIILLEFFTHKNQ